MEVSASPPFSVCVFTAEDGATVSPLEKTIAVSMPATIRSGKNKDLIDTPHMDLSFLSSELIPDKINGVQDLLWLCGRPMPPRSLHYQILHSRTIIVAEAVELHLVWHRDRIFIKPLPRYLLDPAFWSKWLSKNSRGDVGDLGLRGSALGLLYSYTALIAYPSDFKIAKDLELLPKDVEWSGWQLLAKEVLTNHDFSQVNPRYWYGELRVTRLNKVYKLSNRKLFRGFSSVASHTAYKDLAWDNFATLAAAFGFVVIILTAMQVGLGTNRLQENQAFVDASYGFTIFSIIGPLAAIMVILVVVMALFCYNLMETKAYQARRFREMKVNRKGWNVAPVKATV